MPIEYKFGLPTDLTGWELEGTNKSHLTWKYDGGNQDLLKLYDKGKQNQWDASDRIDWSLEVDPEDPMQLDDRMMPLYGSAIWDKLDAKARRDARYHSQVFTLSNFMHGEQGALVCAAKIVQDVPNIESKFYAATQVIDEARHVEAYSRLLREKFEFAYPITPPLRHLLDQTIRDSRWDFTYLGMQVLIEGLALAAFQRIRDYSDNLLCSSINAYVMQDEARHVAFGRTALREFYPQLTQVERNEREDFLIEGCYLLRDRFDQMEVWENLGLNKAECVEALNSSEHVRLFRQRLFSRIVPTVKDIGLWSQKVQDAFTDLGGIQFADIDAQAQMDQDEAVAEEFDATVMDMKNRVAEANETSSPPVH